MGYRLPTAHTLDGRGGTWSLLAAFWELQASGGGPHAVAEFASAMRGPEAPMAFVQLLAPFGSAAVALPHLRKSADATRVHSATEVEAALATTMSFPQDVHTRGLGAAVGLLHSRGQGVNS